MDGLILPRYGWFQLSKIGLIIESFFQRLLKLTIAISNGCKRFSHSILKLCTINAILITLCRGFSTQFNFMKPSEAKQ